MSEQPREKSERAGLITARLMLRPTEAADSGLIETLTRGSVRDDIADARAWMARARLSANAEVFSVIEASSRQLVGSAGLIPAPGDETGAREMCLWIAEPFGNRGYGTQAAKALVDHAFSNPAVGTIWFVCRSTNLRARRLIERCGFTQRDSGMARSVALRAVVSVERYQLDRRDWRSLTGLQLPARGQHHAGDIVTH
ncbi:MAG: GNAT family N-acetyltransferase [Bauldia sp.]|nr:GNAT family N-acetyltransferase [Bauldia sp.]